MLIKRINLLDIYPSHDKIRKRVVTTNSPLFCQYGAFHIILIVYLLNTNVTLYP
jgi:hypothetical protein